MGEVWIGGGTCVGLGRLLLDFLGVWAMVQVVDSDSSTADSDHSIDSTAVTSRRGPSSPFELFVQIVQKITEKRYDQIKLITTSTGDSTASYITGEPEPFGVLGAGGSEGEFVLWTDAYEESSCIQTDGRDIEGGCDGGPSVELNPGEDRSETYEFRATPGTHKITQEVLKSMTSNTW
jgi:hypothetical protein